MQKLFRRNVINVLLCVGIILSGIKKKKKGGTRRGETKAEELLSADECS